MTLHHQRVEVTRWRGRCILLLTLVATTFPARTAESTNRTPAAAWDATFRASVGGGYRDNVLGTAIRPESSAFEEVSGDVSVMRFTESGSYLSLFLLGEDRRYFNSEAVPKEQLFSGTARGRVPAGVIAQRTSMDQQPEKVCPAGTGAPVSDPARWLIIPLSRRVGDRRSNHGSGVSPRRPRRERKLNATSR